MAGEVARGGMGAILRVYDDDLRRPLAMKVVLGDPGHGSETPKPEEIDQRRMARFLEEAQITGQLEHPGIVPVHELGIDDEGRAYFTMRLVRGRDLESILALANDQKEGWTLARVVGVMLRVAEAMAFAHDRKVLHRDLKPANIMVGPFGEVYVMDWGLARVLGEADRHDMRLRQPEHSSIHIATDRREHAQGSDSNLYTMDGDVVGTPAYMSPEQARGELDQLDARSDVYALGAVLYRALAGHAPYSHGGSRPAHHVLFDLLKGPPEPLGPLCPHAPIELIAIADKAMARAPVDRYPTALAFADDLRAFLELRVVSAHKTGAWAEARKWIQRNRALAASLLLAVLLLAAGLVTSLALMRESERQTQLAEHETLRAEEQTKLALTERHAAEVNHQRAERQANVARAINAFLNDDVLASVSPEDLGVDVTMREVLQEASARLDYGFDNEPEVESALRMTIGQSLALLGEPKQAQRQFERAVELRRRELGPVAEETLQARLRLSAISSELGDMATAEKALLAIRGEAAAAHGEEHNAVMVADNDLALLYSNTGRRGEARALYERTLQLQERVRGDEDPETVTTRINLGTLLTDMGELDAAEPLLLAARTSSERRIGKNHPGTFNAANALALLRLAQGRFAEAETMFQSLLERRREAFGEGHYSCGRLLGSLGMVRTQLGRLTEARSDLEGAVAILDRRLGDDHPWTLAASANLAACMVEALDLDAALPLRERTLAAQKRVLGDEHPETLTSMSNLATIYRGLGRSDEAEKLTRETLAIEERALGRDHPDTLITRENLAGVLFAAARYQESLALVNDVLEGRKRTLGDDHPAVTRTMYNLAMLRRAAGDDAAAEPMFEAVLQRHRDSLTPGHPAFVDVLARLAAYRTKAKDFAAAERHYQEAITIREATSSPDTPESTLLHHDLGVMLLQSGDLPRAATELRATYERRLRVHGKDHEYPISTGYALGAVLLAQQDFAAAEPLFVAFAVRREAEGRLEEPDAQRCVGRLVEVYEKLGREVDAAAWRQKQK